MEKVEQYIREHTHQFSNEDGFDYIPWLTPDQARSVAEIAREETIKEVCEWMNNNVFRYVDRNGISLPMYYTNKCIEDLKKYLDAKR